MRLTPRANPVPHSKTLFVSGVMVLVLAGFSGRQAFAGDTTKFFQSASQSCALLNLVSDPRALASAMLAGMTPQTYLSFMQRLTNPQAARQYFAGNTPLDTLDKTYSSVDPEFDHALLTRDQNGSTVAKKQIADPAYMQPAVYQFSVPAQSPDAREKIEAQTSLQTGFAPLAIFHWIRLSLPHATPHNFGDLNETPQRY